MGIEGPGSILLERLLQESDKKGFLSLPAVERISRSLSIPASRAYAVAAQLECFAFSRHPGPTLDICCGPACALAGSGGLYDDASREVAADLGGQVERSLGSPYWHVPIMTGLDGPGGRRFFQNLKPGGISALRSLAKGDGDHRTRPLATGIEAREQVLCMKGERVATAHKGKAVRGVSEFLRGEGRKLARFLSENDSDAIRRMIRDSRLKNSMSSGELAGDIAQIPRTASDARLVVCDIGGIEPENSPGPTLAAMDPLGVATGVIIAARAVEATRALVAVPHEDVELVKLFTRVIIGLNKHCEFSGVEFELFRVPNFIPCDREIGIASLFRGLTFSEGVSRARESKCLLWGSHALVSEPEVFLKLSWMVSSGARAYRARKGGGTAVVSIGGSVKRPVLAEVPLGTSLTELLEVYAGGLLKGADLKAIHFGGVFGGPLRRGARRSSLGNLLEKYPEAGSGQILAIERSTCMVEWSRYLARLAERMCCGACAPGRIGPTYVSRLLDRISTGDTDPADLEEIDATISLIRETSLCVQGEKILNPVRICLENFSKEFREHIEDKKCDAGVCRFQTEGPGP